MLRLNRNIAYNAVDDGVVVLEESSGQYLHLDAAAHDALRRLANGESVESITNDVLLQNPGVSAAQVREDYESLVRMFLKYRLLEER